MSEPEPPWLVRRRKLFMRPDADRYRRQDFARFLPPGSLAQKANFDPDQPRDELGQWTDSGGSGTDVDEPPSSRDLAGVIRICLAGARSLVTDFHGNKSYTVIYECAGGRSITRSGAGFRYPAFIIDPLQ